MLDLGTLRHCEFRGCGNSRPAASAVPGERTESNGKDRTDLMLVFLLTLLSAVTLLIWRHYRRDDASPRWIERRI